MCLEIPGICVQLQATQNVMVHFCEGVFANGCPLALTVQWLLIREQAWVPLLTPFNTRICFLQQKVPFFSLTYIQSSQNKLLSCGTFWHMSLLLKHAAFFPSEISGAFKGGWCRPHSPVAYAALVGESRVVERGQNWGPLGSTSWFQVALDSQLGQALLPYYVHLAWPAYVTEMWWQVR